MNERLGARWRHAWVSALWLLLLASPVDASDAVLYRIFLRDGTVLVSYGEFARVADQLVFSTPIGELGTTDPRLQLVSLGESLVDWERTDAYAQAARAKRYAETRGEADFANLSTEVARALNQVALTDDAAKRLALADQARRTLADWPAHNYGYRAADVAQLTLLMDEVVSELRVAAGLSRFDLSLMAGTPTPAEVPLLPAPTLRDSIEQAFTLSRLTTDSAQRHSLLGAIVEGLSAPAETGGWAAALRARAASELRAHVRVDRAYAEFSERVLTAAEEKRRQADVKGIEALIKQALKLDDRLGRARPQTSAALLATLDLRLEQARRLRLARDRWAVRRDIVRAYERRARTAMNQLFRARPTLELIQQLAGPSPKSLPPFRNKTAAVAREFSLIKPAAELETVHGILTSAFQMALVAVDSRVSAINSNDMATAWQASSAAAGALMLVERAREELRQLTVPPTQ